MCDTNLSGHSGQPGGGDDPPFSRSPESIPLEVLRDFVRDQAVAHTYRTLAKKWDVSAETLRKFALRLTEQPHPRQVMLYATSFLELHPSGYVREKRVDGRAVALQQLKMLLPPDRESAHEVLDRILGGDARGPGEAPEQAEAVRAWMHKLLNAEFDAEVRLARDGRKRRKPKE